jgi:hypothetical protein
MRDGMLLPWSEVGESRATVDLVDSDVPAGPHWYVVTAEADPAGDGPSILAHASPFFVTVE